MASSTILKATRLTLLGAVLLTAVAMLLYPGGTSLDPDVRGYSFFHNSLSDLGATVAWNGEPNPGAVVQLLASVAFAVGGCLGFAILVPAYSTTPLSRMLARVAGVVIAVSGVSLIGIALAAEDRHPALHGRLTVCAVACLPVATSLLAVAAVLGGRFSRSVSLCWLGLTIVVVAWMLVMSIQPATDLELAVPVTLQKLVALSILGTLAFQTREAERVSTGGAVGRETV